jgi:CPA2 family monovalent cation:H+ antiporter-2
MHGAHAFLTALTTVLCVAAVTTILFQRLRQPVILGYLIAGLIIGPHVPIPLVADPEIVETLSELGVILLMFSVGLELRLRTLVRMAPTAGVTAVVQCSLMVWLGFLTGRLFGWTTIESLFAGGAIAISSTTIIAKAFDEQNVRGRLRETVVGILVVEDLIAIVLIATLTAIATGERLSAAALAATVGRLAAFLVGLLVVGLLVVPRAVRAVVRMNRPETTVVASVGICFGAALLARAFGYSVALGAFIAGSLVAESGHDKEIEHLIQPVRDIFAAIFFVSVGMMIDPALVARHGLAIAVLTLVVVTGKIVSVTLGTFLTGGGVRTSVQAGMSLAQIGEFSFIIAGVGLTLGATRDFLYPIAVTVSAVTTLLTPWLIRAAAPAASFVDHKLPRALQTFVALYGSWIEQLRRPGRDARTAAAALRRLVRLLLVDAALVAAVIIGATLSIDRAADLIHARVGAGRGVARAAVLVATAGLSLPFLVGIVRVARRLGVTLAAIAFPATDGDHAPAGGRIDLAAAPRGALVVTLQLASVLLVGAPILAITQPFLRGPEAAAALILLLAALGVAFWRSATNLEGHVRAGAQMIVAALATRLLDANPQTVAKPSGDSAGGAKPDAVHGFDRRGAGPGSGAPRPPDLTAAELDRLLPGLGAPLPVTLDGESPAVGRTLAQLNLRAVTGATVLAIVRGGAGVRPTADEPLHAGDVLALAGTQEAMAAATRAVLGDGADRLTDEKNAGGSDANDGGAPSKSHE